MGYEELLVEDVRQQAERAVELGGVRRAQWRYASVAHLLLEHGRLFRPAPLAAPYRALPARQCYANAFAMASVRPELVYAEGYAVVDYDGDLMHFQHAWCVREDGGVVDPTWPDPGVAYLGVAIGPQKGAPRLGPGLFQEPSLYWEVLREGLPPGALVEVGRPVPAVTA